MRRVIVRIDSLVLKGFRREDRHAIARGLQAQLTAMLSEQGTAQRLAGLGSVPQLCVQTRDVRPDMKPGDIGAAVARGIGGGLGQ